MSNGDRYRWNTDEGLEVAREPGAEGMSDFIHWARIIEPPGVLDHPVWVSESLLVKMPSRYHGENRLDGGKTGWPAGLLQDDSRELSKALASKPDARRLAREAAEQARETTYSKASDVT